MPDVAGRLADAAGRLAREPPFRLLAKAWLRVFARRAGTQARWGTVPRPWYLTGVLAAAALARSDGVDRITVAELGVAGGAGLLELQRYGAQVQAETGVVIDVVGFDLGSGLPDTGGDVRDHPDVYRAGDYPMPRDLPGRLDAATRLVLGDVADTVPAFVADRPAPLGFLAVDLDLHSATMAGLGLLDGPRLRRVALYFDDIAQPWSHRFAGERLAIADWNASDRAVKIDAWHGLAAHVVDRDAPWLARMFQAHDLAAVATYNRPKATAHL